MARTIQTDSSMATGWAKGLPGAVKDKLDLVSNMILAMAIASAALDGDLE